MGRTFWASLWLGLAMGAVGALSAQAHEFWIWPEDFTLDAGMQVRANIRNGSHMVGVDLPYLPENLPRYEVILGDTVTPIIARAGDMPAINQAVAGEGLAIVVAETTDLLVPYDDFTKFEAFVTHKAMPQILQEHAARGLPTTNFTESFHRYAKSLVAIGDGAGADRPVGFRLEIVTLANPFTDDLTKGMPMQVLMDGKPRAGSQLLVMQTAPDGTVTETPYTTDADGKILAAVQPGSIYLADNVDIYALPNNDPGAGPVWHSDWASLTFTLP